MPANKKKKYRVPKTQSIELKKVYKFKCPSKHTSVPLWRENKTGTRREIERLLGKKVDGERNGNGV